MVIKINTVWCRILTSGENSYSLIGARGCPKGMIPFEEECLIRTPSPDSTSGLPIRYNITKMYHRPGHPRMTKGGVTHKIPHLRADLNTAVPLVSREP